jgi:hypothetical protein
VNIRDPKMNYVSYGDFMLKVQGAMDPPRWISSTSPFLARLCQRIIV